MSKNNEFWNKQYARKPHFAKSFRASPLARRFVAELKKDKLKGVRILDVGMGNGRDSRFFARRNFIPTGIDIVPKAVKMAESLSTQYGITFENMNVENLTYDDNFFGGVYSIGVLHSTNISKSFKEIKRVLKSRGLFMAMMFLRDKNNIESRTFLSDVALEIENLKFNVLDLYVITKKERGDDHDSVIFLVQK